MISGRSKDWLWNTGNCQGDIRYDVNELIQRYINDDSSNRIRMRI